MVPNRKSTAVARTRQEIEDRLAGLEARVENGLAAYMEMGQALEAIRGERLWEASHDSFGAYLRVRWGLSRQRASQLMQAARIAKILDEPPVVEAQARELASLADDPPGMRAVWREVQQGDAAPTAGGVRAIVQSYAVAEPGKDRAERRAMGRVARALAALAQAVERVRGRWPEPLEELDDAQAAHLAAACRAAVHELQSIVSALEAR